MNFLAAFDSSRRNTKKTSVSYYWSRLITELWRFQSRYSTVLFRRPDFTISGQILSLHIFVIILHRSWLPICSLHISTWSIDRRNETLVSCFSRFYLRLLYVTFIQKMINLGGWILLCHLIDWVETWRKTNKWRGTNSKKKYRFIWIRAAVWEKLRNSL